MAWLYNKRRNYPKRFLGVTWGAWQIGSGDSETRGLLIWIGRQGWLIRIPIAWLM